MDRFLKGVGFIENNLRERFTVADVARSASFSTYHYCRLFQALTGESVMGYARSRRLTQAAMTLANGADVRLIDLALDSGFDSQEAFTRAFKRRFGITPGAVRRAKHRWSPHFRFPLDAAALAHLKEGLTMEPKIIERGDFHVVGLRDTFTLDNNSEIPELWGRFWPHCQRIANIVPGVSLGVSEMLDKETGHFGYIASVEVTEIGEVPEDLASVTLEGGRFAVFTHKIRSANLTAELPQTFRYIYGTWAEKSSEKLRANYDIEYYDERFDPLNLSGEIDIYVPIR